MAGFRREAWNDACMTSRSRIPAEVLWRSIIAILLGIVAGFVAAPFLGIAAGLVTGWGVAALAIVVWVLVFLWPMDPARTRAHAIREDPGRRVSRIVSIAGSVASLGAVAVVLIQTKSAPLTEAIVLAGLAVFSVATSWLLIQTNYMLRYAHVYYNEPVGGIEFHADTDPLYTDFIYFSVGLGMTYQVADTNVTTNEIRRIVIGQTVLAWIFATVIIATVINLVTGIGPSTPAS